MVKAMKMYVYGRFSVCGRDEEINCGMVEMMEHSIDKKDRQQLRGCCGCKKASNEMGG